MMAPRRKVRRKSSGGVIGKVRKPTAPPLKIEQSATRYRRNRERERIRREEKET